MVDERALILLQQDRPGSSMRRLSLALAAALILASFASSQSRAQSYPSKPVTLVVAFTPGGPSDVLSRILGRNMGDRLGKSFVIENRPGAGGNIAAELVSRAAPDGYTLLMGNNSILATNAALYTSIKYDPIKDFQPISLVGSQANILIVNPKKMPVHSMAEFIELVKANPGKYTYASSGYGAGAHLAAELFKTEAKVQIGHIPYKGAAPALQDVIAGEVDLMFATAASVAEHIKAGLVRPLAVTTLKRTAAFPDIPTVDELGIKGFDATTWHGLVAPTGMPPAIVDKLHDALVAALKDDGVNRQLATLGVEIVGSTPNEFAEYIKMETPKWTEIVRASGAKVD
jgi:tripartite-type tricarboxylate transporter receptor subunit TctC